MLSCCAGSYRIASTTCIMCLRMRESVRIESLQYSYHETDAEEKWYWLIRVSLSCLLIVFRCAVDYSHVSILSLSEQRKRKWNSASRNEIWGSIELEKINAFGKYCPTKPNWQGFWNDHYLPGGTSWSRWQGSSRSAFFMQQDTTQWLDWGLRKRLGREGKKAVYAAICVKKAGSITNLGSREGQDEHGVVIIHCTSTRVMEEDSVCGAALGGFHRNVWW